MKLAIVILGKLMHSWLPKEHGYVDRHASEHEQPHAEADLFLLDQF